MALIWLSVDDLFNATSPTTVTACFDDSNVGVPNPTAVTAVLDRAEQETLSWLVTELGPPPLPANIITELAGDNFLKYAALELAIAYMFDRHPEYVRAAREEDVQGRIKRFEERMTRILDARQRPPTVLKPPANVGGTSVDNAARIYVDSPGGPAGNNAGDF